ncbi:MAG: bifunctional 4-hydroxy-2-oxoglutarate aldolase/2-dehydro-3-deoxy-phosphogluconate aldolase [Anaerolineaceae bacterium]|nr:bifunctional 4-hydroxy-2-oxoglutarate aldolase/2-dehydro-3-deoxy-phosphogluconate aldolase [Anaerolineaceae bacterium]
MDSQTAYETVARSGLMAGMRGAFASEVALPVTEALLEADINVFEFTMNSEGALDAMRAAKRAYGDSACVGMGTVLDVETARRVLDAGADFIVSPAFNPGVVQAALAADVLVAPGVITPTECVDAWALGVKLLKIFPIGSLGLDYFKAIRGPLNHMNFMCNGGMDDQNVPLFLKNGAVACGMAGWLTGDGTWPVEKIRQRGRLLRELVTSARTGVPRSITA